MLQKQLFIVIDGSDGSGKNTQAKLIARYYKTKGHENIRIRSHPAEDNRFGRKAKQSLEEESNTKGFLNAALFYALDVIRSVIKYYRSDCKGILVFSRYLLGVCYLPSSLIHFGYNFFATFLPVSQYFFFLDVSPEIARERISERGRKEEMFETLPRLLKMQRKMRFITEKKDWFRIDGDGSPKEVWEQIKRILIQLESEK